MKKAPFFVIILLCCTAFPISAQKKIKVTGTGNTTGHIANLTIHNGGNTTTKINGQTAFIPSDGKYQPYIVTIPPTTVPPGTITIPLSGYCADVTAPPVPPGESLPPVDDWIGIDQVTPPGPGEPLGNIVEQTVPRFSVSDIPRITGSSGYTPKPPPGVPEIKLTWPGSDIIIDGVLDPDKDPKSAAPVLIEALQNIENAFDSLRGAGEITTPISGDPPRERESVIQQTFWIYAAGLTGERYQKENFTTKVIDQYEHNVGIAVANIPEPERKKLDEGVDAFWNTFMATGVEAKVLSVPMMNNVTAPGKNLPEGDDTPPGITISVDDLNCECGDAQISVRPYLKGRFEKNESHPRRMFFDINNVRDTAWMFIEDEMNLVKAKPDDEIRIQVVTYQAFCNPCKTDSCKVTEKKLAIKAEGLDKFKSYTDVKENKDGSYDPPTGVVQALDKKAKPPLKPEDNPVRIYFKLNWTCVDPTAACKLKKCERKYELVVNRYADKVKKEGKK